MGLASSIDALIILRWGIVCMAVTSLSVCMVFDYWVNHVNDEPMSVRDIVAFYFGEDKILTDRVRHHLTGENSDIGNKRNRKWKRSSIKRIMDQPSKKDLLVRAAIAQDLKESWESCPEPKDNQAHDLTIDQLVEIISEISTSSSSYLKLLIDSIQSDTRNVASEYATILKSTPRSMRKKVLVLSFGQMPETRYDLKSTPETISHSRHKPIYDNNLPNKIRTPSGPNKIIFIAAILFICGSMAATNWDQIIDLFFTHGATTAIEKSENQENLAPTDRYKMAWVLYQRGQVSDLEKAQEILLDLMGDDDFGLRARASYILGMVNLRLGNLDSGAYYFGISEINYKKLPEPSGSNGLSRIILSRAEILRLQGKPKQAYDLASTALPGLEKLNRTASILQDLSEWNQLVEVSEEIIKIGSDRNMNTVIAQGHSFLGYALLFKGKLDEGITHTNIAHGLINDEWANAYNLLNKLAHRIITGEPAHALELELHHLAAKLNDANLSLQISRTRERASQINSEQF